MNDAPTALIHGTCVAVGERGILILGESGTGKSGLALQLIAFGAALVADDQLVLQRKGQSVVAVAPDSLRGLIEARGIGILRVKAVDTVKLLVVVDLDVEPTERLPMPQTHVLLGVKLDLISGKDVANLAAALIVKISSDWVG